MIFVFEFEQNFRIPTPRNNSGPRGFLRTGILYGLILFLPYRLIFVSESFHTTAIYTIVVLSTDCNSRSLGNFFPDLVTLIFQFSYVICIFIEAMMYFKIVEKCFNIN